MQHKYSNVRVDLLKMCTKYIPKGFYADGKQYEIKEIVEVKKGFIRCGSPGVRYVLITDKKTQNCSTINGQSNGQRLFMTRRARKKSHTRKYLTI